MAKSLPIPAWFRGLIERSKEKVAEVQVAVKQSLCPHWDKQETTWAHSADPEKRKVMDRRATCILCGRVEKPESWHDFKVSIPGPAAREALAEKAGIRE